MRIIFATTNKGKLAEANKILGVEVTGTPLDVEEIQSLDEEKVARAKAAECFKQIGKPLIVEDTSLRFNALNGLPGTYISDFSKALGNNGLIHLLDGHTDRTAIAVVTIAYADENGNITTFQGSVNGSIATSERGTNGFGWDPIFIPESCQKTFAEMTDDEKNTISMRAIALTKLKKYITRILVTNATP